MARRRARFTRTEIAAALAAAAACDPQRIVEVTAEGAIRILPPAAGTDPAQGDEVAAWLARHGEDAGARRP